MAERKFLYFSDTEYGPTESDGSSDTIALAGIALTGDCALSGGAKVTGVPTPTSGTDAASKTYVDNLVSGLGWKDPVNSPMLLGNVDCMSLVGNAAASVIEVLTTDGDAYVVTAADGAAAVSTAVIGDVWQYVGSTWTKLSDGAGGFVADGVYALLSTTTALISPYTDSTDDGKRADFDGTSLTGDLVVPDNGDSYVIGGSGSKYEGDMREWSGTAWVQLEAASGGYVASGVRAILALTAAETLITPYTEATDDGKLVEFTGSSNTGVATGDAVDKAAVLVQDTEHVGYFDNLGYVYEGTVPTGSWIQFTGSGTIIAGAGLTKDGNTLNIGEGDGIAVGADEIAVDLASNPGLEFSGGDLLVKVAGDKGVILSANGVEIEIDDTPDTLDVDSDGLKVVGLPSLFKVNDVAVGATVTAANFDTLTDTSNADALHYHASSPATEAPKIEDTHTNAATVTADQVVRWSATDDKITPALPTSAANARAIGVARTGGAAEATSEIVKYGICAGAIAAATVGTPYFLGTSSALVLLASVPKPGRVVRIGFAANATDLDVQIQDYGKRL